MNLLEYIQLSIKNLLVNKVRSFLTMLGIMIGVFNITLVMAVLQGGREMILKEIGSLGSNVVYVYASEESYFTGADIFTIKRIPNIARIFPEIYIPTQMKIGKNMHEIYLHGTSPDINIILNIDITEGRFFLKNDEDQKKKVCVIGERLKWELFRELSPIGKDLKIKGDIFRIVGVAKEKVIFKMMGGHDVIYIPLSTAQRILGTEKIRFLQIIVKDIEKIEDVTKKIEEILNKKPGSFDVYNMQEFVDTTRVVTGIIALVISLIAGISLVVGGVGIMNIMLVQVRERTREIGIRKAVGASNQNILTQFLIESCVLSLSGGIIGMVIGLLVANIIAFFLELPFLISLWHVFIGFVVACLVGIIFGIYPARIAAKLSPVEALRYE